MDPEPAFPFRPLAGVPSPPPLPLDLSAPPPLPPASEPEAHPIPPTAPPMAIPDHGFEKPRLISIPPDHSIWTHSECDLRALASQVRADASDEDKSVAGRIATVVKQLSQRRREPDVTGLIGDPSRRSLAAECNRTQAEIQFTLAEEREIDGDLWFIGDAHGDLLAFRALLAYGETVSRCAGRRANFFFLGDLIDDGPFGHLVLLEFFERLLRANGRIGFVVGNHDIGLRCDGEGHSFGSSVTPCDFADWLNKLASGSHWHPLATEAIQFFKRAPRAVLLPDGTLVSHGGVPHKDLQARMKFPADLLDAKCLHDFTWTRAHETAPRKVPNRSSSGCEFGVEDFQDFCRALEGWIGRPVRGLVRGHDHVPNRWAFPDRYHPTWLLTINAMCTRQRDPFGPYERQPVLARHIPGHVPELHQIEIPADVIRNVYPPPGDNT